MEYSQYSVLTMKACCPAVPASGRHGGAGLNRGWATQPVTSTSFKYLAFPAVLDAKAAALTGCVASS